MADLSHSPACILTFLAGSLLASEMISAIASSTTERVLENGALNTAIPRLAAASRSTWLVPMQNAPTASRPSALARTRSVTWVCDLMPSRLTPVSASMRSSSPSARGSVWT